MEEEKFQKELFEFDNPKRNFNPFRGLSKTDFNGKLTFSAKPEHLILGLIALTMLVVVIFALGVEKGKRINLVPGIVKAPSWERKAAHPDNAKLKLIYPSVRPAASTTQGKPSTAVSREIGRYTIVAATFRSNDAATVAVSELRKKGLDAHIAKSGDYIQVRVGSYKAKEDASKDIYTVRKAYGDAYLRTA